MSMQRVADMVGVSKATVSFVANGRPGVSSDTANRVVEAMKEIGYVHKIARPRRRRSTGDNHGTYRKTGEIGILMASGTLGRQPFHARLYDAIHQQLEVFDFKMAPLRYSGEDSAFKQSLSGLDGMLLFAYHSELSSHIPIPFVSILGEPDLTDELYADHIEPANNRVGALAANYFYRRGHKHVLGINPKPGDHPAFSTRLRHFSNLAAANKMKIDLADVPFADSSVFAQQIEADGLDTVRKFVSEYQSLPDRPTGIFVPCDSHLVLIQKCFGAAGFKAGVDIEFLGCNNDRVVLAGLEAHPATIDINPDAIAEAAIVALLHRIDYPQAAKVAHKIISIEPTLVEAGVGVKELW